MRREADVHPIVARVDAGARIVLPEQPRQPLGQRRLADAEGLHRSHVQGWQREPVAEPGNRLLAPHSAHLARDPGQEHEDTLVAVDPPAGGRADWIVERHGRGNPGGLLAVGGWHRPICPEPPRKGGHQAGILRKWLAERVRSGLPGQVVVRWPQPAGRDHEGRPRAGIADGRGDHGSVVGQLPDPARQQPKERQLTGEIGRIGVHRLPDQELRTNAEQLARNRLHPRECRVSTRHRLV